MEKKADQNFNFGSNVLGVTPAWQLGSTSDAYKDPYGINTEMTKDQDEYWAPGRYIPPELPSEPEHSCSKVQTPNFESIINFEETAGPDQEFSDKIRTFDLPFYGRIQIVKHKPGYCHISFIIFYWLYGNWSMYSLILLPHYREGNMPLFVLFFYGFVSINTIIALFRASTLNPGREIIKGKKDKPPIVDPHNPNQEIRPIEGVNKDYCRRCFQYRPYRAHHCGVCGQCVRRFDHHCPWINNCVGEDNHYAFLQLVFYAFMMSATAFLLEMCHWYYLPRYNPEVHLTDFALSHIRAFMNWAVGMSIGMACFGAGLASSTAFGVMFDMATVDWRRLETAVRNSGRFDWDMLPKKQPCLKSYRMFCGPGSVLGYLFACRRKAKMGKLENM